ncbi:hypothetical protein [Zavarzinella formosa]|uniref:hypothetical protein n=1 Tax=Zavarzinella formosa TaxID=360055 RepID=UPI0002F425BC|nr:hypothetical protein [Zavarzinella formosa]
MRFLPTITGNPTRLLTGLALCVTALPAFAEEPTPSRVYPQTYTDRVTPWYDPSGWYRKIENAFTKDEPPVKSEKVPIVTAVPVSESNPTTSVSAVPSGTKTAAPIPVTSAPTVSSSPVDAMMVRPAEAGPAWKWYGYGTVTPSQNPLAPQGSYKSVPHDWHAQNGTTPGALPSLGSPLMVNTKPQPEPMSTPMPLATKTNIGSPPAPPKSNVPDLGPASPSITDQKPLGPDIVMPTVETPKDEEHKLPAVVTPPAIVPATPVVNEGSESIIQPAPAVLKPPKPDQQPVEEETPASAFPTSGAILRRPIRIESPDVPTPVLPAPVPVPTPAPEQPRTPAVEQRPVRPIPAPVPEQPRMPVAPQRPIQPVERPDGAALPSVNTDSPDIPVESAPGIVIPGSPGSMSRLARPSYIARAQQPNPLEEAIRRTAGEIVRDIRPTGPNAFAVVLKPGNIDAAWQARERLSKLPELKRLTITFEIPAR